MTLVSWYTVTEILEGQINTSCFISDSLPNDKAPQHGNTYFHAFMNNFIIINMSFQVFTVGFFSDWFSGVWYQMLFVSGY
jgi:hypothetical protein